MRRCGTPVFFSNNASIYLSSSSPTLSNITVRFGSGSLSARRHRINRSSAAFRLGYTCGRPEIRTGTLTTNVTWNLTGLSTC